MQKVLKFVLPLLYFVALFPLLPETFGNSYTPFFVLFSLCVIYALKILFAGKSFKCSGIDICVILAISLCKIMNVVCIHSYLLGLVIFVIGLAAVTGLFAESSSKIKLYWLSLLTVLSLPIAEYTQIFIGTPLRFLSASIAGNVLAILGYNQFLQTTIINIENTFVNIDYPCSGNNTILVIMIFTAIIGFMYRVKLSVKSLSVVLLSIFCFILLNITRILVLVLMYNSADAIPQDIMSVVHTSLGLINFGIVIILIFYYFSRLNNKWDYEIKSIRNYSYIYVLVLGFVLLCLKFLNVNNSVYNVFSSIKADNGTSFTEQEIDFFNKHNAQVKKTVSDNGIIKLMVKSCSWTSHHNPENCIKGSGRKIISSKIIAVGEYFFRVVETDKGYIYFYFSDGLTVTDDYYKRVYYSLFTKSKCWTMVEYSSKYPLDKFILISSVKELNN